RVEPLRRILATLLQQGNHFCLGPRLGFFGLHLPDQGREVDAVEAGPLVLVERREAVEKSDMSQHLPHRADSRRRGEIVPGLGNLFGNLDGVVADRAKRTREILASVTIHVISPWFVVEASLTATHESGFTNHK